MTWTNHDVCFRNVLFCFSCLRRNFDSFPISSLMGRIFFSSSFVLSFRNAISRVDWCHQMDCVWIWASGDMIRPTYIHSATHRIWCEFYKQTNASMAVRMSNKANNVIRLAAVQSSEKNVQLHVQFGKNDDVQWIHKNAFASMGSDKSADT